MSAEQELANANVQISTLISEVTRWRDASAGLNSIYPTITEGRQSVGDGKYFSVPGAGAYMRLYRRQGSSAELIAEFPDRTELNSVIDQLGPLLGRGVVGGGGDLMAEGAFGLGVFDSLGEQITDYKTMLANGSYTGNGSNSVNYPNDGSSRFGSFLNLSRYGNQFRILLDATDAYLTYIPRDLSAIRNAKLYHEKNILGTVSQSGGVPTGAIIERGSNANGEYVKFADGTLICIKRFTEFTYGNANYLIAQWSFPSVFSSAPTVLPALYDARVYGGTYTLGELNGANHQIMPRTCTSLDTELRLVGGNGFVEGDTYITSVKAIGRWY